MSPTRTMAACLKSVAQEGVETPLRVTDLVNEEVRAVEAHQLGFVLRFGSGAKLFVPSGVALDGAGNRVIEP